MDLRLRIVCVIERGSSIGAEALLRSAHLPRSG
jgi:hypothetical protein